MTLSCCTSSIKNSPNDSPFGQVMKCVSSYTCVHEDPRRYVMALRNVLHSLEFFRFSCTKATFFLFFCASSAIVGIRVKGHDWGAVCQQQRGLLTKPAGNYGPPAPSPLLACWVDPPPPPFEYHVMGVTKDSCKASPSPPIYLTFPITHAYCILFFFHLISHSVLALILDSNVCH